MIGGKKRGDKREADTHEEAALWVAKLASADCTAAERADFEAWAAADPARRSAYEELLNVWRDLGRLPRPARRASTKRRSRTRKLLAVLLIVGAAAAGAGYSGGFWARLRADISTGIGEVRESKLADGTTVVLNTDTALLLKFDSEQRRVVVLRGEAYFDVAADAARPFVTTGGELEARAVGTRFAVARTAPATVTIEEGRVEVSTDSERVTASAGEQIRAAADGRMVLARVDAAEETAWRGGKLIFSQRPLREIAATLERYRWGRIIVADQRAAELTVSGVFDTADTDRALGMLERTLPVRIIRISRLLVIIRSSE